MNFTSYEAKDKEYQIYYGKASIADGYYIVNADEEFYRFVGKKSGFPVTELVHPEDVTEFVDAVERLDEGPQHLVVRFLRELEEYSYVYLRLTRNGKRVNGFSSYDMELSDIMCLMNRQKFSQDLVEKYRTFMSLYDGMFLEYDYEDDRLQIYEYFNEQSKRIYYKVLSEEMEEVMANPNFSTKQKEEFQAFGQMIMNGVDRFKTSLDAQTIIEGMQDVRLIFQCSVLYKDDTRYKLVGIVHYAEKNKKKEAYYLSEYAIEPMTGLLNKRAINEYAIERIAAEKPLEPGKPVGGYLVLIDIDDFKQINDRFGHMFGDEVIAKSAEIFRSVTQRRGMAGRFGGDEFMLVLEYIENEDELRRILKVINKHADWAFQEKEGFNISFSMGVSKFPEDGTTYEELFKKADKALYIAKDKGKKRYIIYREKMHGELLKETGTERSVGLKAAISDVDKYNMLTDMIFALHRDGKKAISEVMKTMQTYFDIDGIAIYSGLDLHREYSSGNYVSPITNLSFGLDSTYIDMFDDKDCYVESIMDHLAKRVPLAYQMNSRQEVGKFMQYMKKKEGRPVAVVSFDFFNRSPKFGNTDTGMMQTIGRLLAEIATEE